MTTKRRTKKTKVDAQAGDAAATWEPVDRLAPWARNPRDNRKAVPKVEGSIKRWGFTEPIVARPSDGRILAGHTRLEAAIRRGMELVPVRWVEMTDEEADAYALADNRLGEIAVWDDGELTRILADLDDGDVDLSTLGWTKGELDELLAGAVAVRGHERARATPDPGPGDLPTKPVSVMGETYRLGPHVLVCGDCTKPEGWEGVEADLVWTDPPYGVGYDGVNRPGHRTPNAGRKAGVRKGDIEGDHYSSEDLRALLRAALGHAYEATRPGGVWYVAAPSGDRLLDFLTVAHELPGVWRHTMAWVKDTHVLGRSDYHYRWEALLYGWKPGAGHAWTGGRKLSNVLEYPRPARSPHHPTQKPIELVLDTMGRHVEPGSVVADPFAGSGTTLIAAAMLSCRAVLWEVSPAYCDVIRRRWATWALSAGQDVGDGLLDRE